MKAIVLITLDDQFVVHDVRDRGQWGCSLRRAKEHRMVNLKISRIPLTLKHVKLFSQQFCSRIMRS